MASWQVGTYRLYQYATDSGTKAVIRLEESGGAHALHAYFRDTTPLPNNSITSGGNFYFLYYPYDTFASVMEMLREEKPIYVHEYGASNIYIGTHAEPVGEEES